MVGAPRQFRQAWIAGCFADRAVFGIDGPKLAFIAKPAKVMHDLAAIRSKIRARPYECGRGRREYFLQHARLALLSAFPSVIRRIPPNQDMSRENSSRRGRGGTG